MPRITGRITGSLEAQDEVIVSLRDVAGGADITSVTITGPGEFSLEAPKAQKYVVYADENCDAWAFARHKIEVDASGGDVANIEFKAVNLVSASAAEDDELDRKFIIDLLQVSLNNAQKIMDEHGVREGREIIRRTIFNALAKDPTPSNTDGSSQQQQAQEQETSGFAPQQQQQWKASPLNLADEEIEPVQKFETLPTGERLVRPLFMALCQTCWNRYYTPNTIYYGNATYLNTCLYNPPCT